MGDHTETLQVDYDPEKVTYAELLDVFWRSHNPAARPWSCQYASAVFFADEDQKRVAEASRDRFEAIIGRPILTEIRPLERFFRAEDYHQKYRLRAHRPLAAELHAYYPGEREFVDSTASARVNGFLDGGDGDDLSAVLDRLGLSEEGRAVLAERARGRGHT